MGKRDIEVKADVEQVVNTQYNLLINDPETKEIFSHLVLEEHLPRIYNFWCFVLQINPEVNKYTGGVFEPHTKLNMQASHFDVWLGHLKTCLAPYEGPKATEWWEKANQQALLFKYKLGIEPVSIPVIKRPKD